MNSSMTATATSKKTLEKRLKQIRAEEAMVGKWLNWITLFLALLYWVLDGRRIGNESGKVKTGSKFSTSYMGWIGGAIAVSKISVRWYYMRRKRDLEVELLEREPSRKEKTERKGKKSKRSR